jgi:hypothetical protein
MRIIDQIRNWYRSKKRGVIDAVEDDYKQRLAIAELTHELAAGQLVELPLPEDGHPWYAGALRASLAQTPLMFQLNLALTLSSTYHVNIYIEDVRLAETVDDIASTVLRQIAARDAIVSAALKRAVRLTV